MHVRFFAIGAVVLTFSVAAITQATPASQSKGHTTAAAQQVTLTGCLQRESDYRRARDAGYGGAAGTSLGASNEFVLVNALIAAAPADAMQTPGAVVGTSGTTGRAYELTGSHEKQGKAYVGKRVEISGTLKAGDIKTTTKRAFGPYGARPPGFDLAVGDLRLREFEVGSIREISGACAGG